MTVQFGRLRQVPGNSLPQQGLLQSERVKGTVPFSLRKACAKIGTVPDHWYIFFWDLPEWFGGVSAAEICGELSIRLYWLQWPPGPT